MSNIVQSLEQAVGASVKGIIGMAEEYLSSGSGESAGASAAEAPSSSDSPSPEPRPIAIGSAPGAMSASSSSDTSSRAPGLLASRLATKDPLIQVTDVPSGWIHLQSTYLDSAAGRNRIRSFGLRNVSSSTVDIEVASDLEDQLVFWSSDDSEAGSSSASSVSASSICDSGTQDIKVSIEAGQTKTMYLAFRPTTSRPSTPGNSTPSSDGGFTPKLPAATGAEEMSPVFGGRLPSTTTATSQGTSLMSDTISTSALSSSNLSQGRNPRRADPVHRSFSVHGSVLVRATSQALDTALDPPTGQDITIPFFATVCRSFFSLAAIEPASGLTLGQQQSSGTLTIDFGTDNAVGSEVHRDMLLVNRSEIDLVWSTSVIHAPNKDSIWFSMRDLDSENVFGVDSSAEPVPLPALSSRHLRLTLRATAPVSDFDFEFVVSNVHQIGNSVTCHAVGSYHCETTDDSLRILSGSTLDYGQINDGTWAKKLISAKNAGDRAIDVHYSATPGYEVVFRLAGVAGEDIDEDVPARPTLADKRSTALSRTSTRDGTRSRDTPAGSRLPHDPNEEWFANERGEGSVGTSSRPLSRVTSRGSSHVPTRTDADSDDSDEPPPASRSTLEPPSIRPSDNLADRDIPNQIEELTMRPGTEYRVFAMYRPARDLTNPPEIAGALRPSTFKVFLDSAPASQRSRPAATRARKVIHATAESCTSLIAIPSGHLIDFGEVTVGASKSTTIAIQNLSALSARVEIAAISKVLNTNRSVIVIPPFETVNERLDFFPRRINDRYEKQVFVRNHLNKANNQLIEVKSKNVDKYNVTLHSHLYKILTPGGSNFLDFGSVVINSPSVRTVQFQNLTNKPLVLDLAASQPEDVELYVKKSDVPPTPCKIVSTKYAPQPDTDRHVSGNLKERFVESLQDKDQKEGDTKVPSKVKGRDKSIKRPHKDDEKPSHASLVAALRKGGRGRPVQLYGNSVVFKDRSLLDDAEYLDLACGPPTSAHRHSPASKVMPTLETIAQEDKSTLSGQHPKILKLDFAASAKSSGLVGKEKIKKPKSSAGIKREPVTPTKPPASTTSTEMTPASPSVSIMRTPGLKQSPEIKSPALTGRRAELKTDPTAITDVTKLTPEELLVAIEQHETKRSASAVTHFSPEEEEQYVRRLLALRKELQSHISSGQFVTARVLTVPPGASRQIVVVMTPNGSTRPHVTTRAKRSESRIFITLLEYDHTHLSCIMGPSADLSELPVRDLVIRSSCVRSVLEVQQSSINFGTIERGEVKSRTIVIHNRSDCVGVFRMRTSGSIASGNLKLGLGRYGVVSAFGRKEVASFSFTPNMVGNYQETIVVENVLDSYNDQNVSVKATVRKMPGFLLDVAKLDMAPSQAGAWPSTASFVITNTSKSERTFVVEVEGEVDESAFAELSLSRDEKDAGQALSKGEEEEVEGLLQKLKIARRKDKPDKIAKYEKRLGELGVTTAATEDTPAEDEPPHSGAVTPATGQVPSTSAISIPLGPNKKSKILVALIPRSGAKNLNTTIKVFDRKNTDETVAIDVCATPNYDETPASVPSPSEPEGESLLTTKVHS